MSDSQPLRAAIIPVTPLQQNCSLIWCTATNRAAFVDPGGDLDKLKAAAEQARVTVEKILLTHGHIDHCGLAGAFAEQLGVPIEGPHEDDLFWIERLGEDGPRFGVPGIPFQPNRWLVDGDTVSVGDLTLDVRHCPGHTPGHVVFHHAESRLALVGDVLFRGSIGRWDFHGQSRPADPLDHGAAVAHGGRYRLRSRARPDVDLRPRTRDQPAGRRCRSRRRLTCNLKPLRYRDRGSRRSNAACGC